MHTGAYLCTRVHGHLCRLMYICAHLCMHTCACTLVHTCACRLTYVRMDVPMEISYTIDNNRYVPTYVRTYLYMQLCIPVHTCALLCTLTYVHLYTLMRAHLCTQIHKCAQLNKHTYVLVQPSAQLCTTVHSCAQLCTLVQTCSFPLLTSCTVSNNCSDGEADGDDNETIMMTMVCTYVHT